MQLGLVAQQRMLSFSELERLCQRGSLDIRRLAHLCGHNILSGHAPSLDLGTAINMLVHLKGEDAGFEPGVMRGWVASLRNETLLRLAEVLDNWVCLEPSEEWRSYVPRLYGAPENTRPHIVRLLPGCCIVTTAWKVKFFTSTHVETLKDESDSWATQGRMPLLVIDADDLARTIKRVCAGPLFTVRPKELRAA